MEELHNEAFCGHPFDTRACVCTVGDGVAASNVTSPEKDNTNPNVNPDSGKTSPQTGESFSILWVILAAVAAVGAVLFCGKKLVRGQCKTWHKQGITRAP